MPRAHHCLALLLALATACRTAAPAIGTAPASAPSAVAAPPAASGGAAVYVVASFTGVFALDGDGRVIGQLLQLPPLSFASGATLHPTGGRLAFVVTRGNLTRARSSHCFRSDNYVL